MLDAKNFSSFCTVKRIEEADIEKALSLCKGNPEFYKHCPPSATSESILADSKKLPKGKNMEDKYYVGFFIEEELTALLDLIDKFPNEETVFLGFFMMNVKFQHKGIGTAIVEDLCRYLKASGYKFVRLGWVKGNLQSEAFWHKNGFWETGVSYETERYKVIVAEKKL